ncbi:MAG TPA: signal peptide peptidase SppA [Nitrospiria bacterium]|nr:signal peptide peptidase SppA [Nitrospiria bacterium]
MTAVPPSDPQPPPARSPLWRAARLFLLALTAVFVAAFLYTLMDESTPFGGRKLALVRIEGVLTDAQDTVDELERYAKDPAVLGIVLRIDSPGGAVVPAQEIYEAVNRLRKTYGKKVVVSMGTVAASGGYYIASASDTIVASPGTLTGSIGVIMEIPNVEGLLKKVGVESIVIKSGLHKDTGSPFRKMRPEERALLQSVLDDVHHQFIEAVAKGRGLTVVQVTRLADGRVFTGRQAKSAGLVDQLGDLHDAIHAAAALVHIEGEPEVIETKPRFSLRELLQSKLFGGGVVGLPTGVRLEYRMAF